MKNIQTLLMAGCLALAGFCRAQSDTYAVVDLSGVDEGWPAAGRDRTIRRCSGRFISICCAEA